MATTKILPVRKRLKDCLDYAANPKKTEIFRGDALDRLMHYTQNEDKTEHQLYVTGFNCDPQNACLIMEATKRRWHKDIGHGNVGYHIIQSFKPGEAGPDQVHQIGCELARRCLADRFECTVSTHLDKGHLHNHIVVNSVSFMDGKMFRNDFKTYYQGIRQISDDLCRQKPVVGHRNGRARHLVWRMAQPPRGQADTARYGQSRCGNGACRKLRL